MLCACSLPSARTSTSHSQSSSPKSFGLAAKEDVGSLPRRQCTIRGAFVLAIVCIGCIWWPLSLVYAEAQAGFQSSLPYHGAERYSSRELSTEGLLVHDVTEQKNSAERRSKFQPRKLLHQGPESADDLTKELYAKVLSDFSPEGMQLSSGYDKFPRRDSHPDRRMLIPATNVCTNKDISISQGPDGSSGIPRYFVQIVNTCMSDCAPSQVHVSCGWFASALLVNPNTFQRLAYNDCLVNGGKPLQYGYFEVTLILRGLVGSSREFISRIAQIIRCSSYDHACTNKDISITQRRDGSPGMPRFSVQIVNTCVSDCPPADIHVFCGWFASSPPPNPNTFQRLSYNDCLVNGGRPWATEPSSNSSMPTPLCIQSGSDQPGFVDEYSVQLKRGRHFPTVAHTDSTIWELTQLLD